MHVWGNGALLLAQYIYNNLFFYMATISGLESSRIFGVWRVGTAGTSAGFSAIKPSIVAIFLEELISENQL